MAIVGRGEIQRVIERLAAFDPSVIRWRLVDDGPAERLVVEPKSEALCGFSMEIEAKGGRDYGFYFGHGASLDSLNPTEYDPLHLVEAVAAGMVDEKLWRLGRSFIARTHATLQLYDGRKLFDDSAMLPWLWRLARPTKTTYSAYPSRG